MEKGYICLNRGALHHEFFRRKEHSEFEAWVWLLTEASWKPRTRKRPACAGWRWAGWGLPWKAGGRCLT